MPLKPQTLASLLALTLFSGLSQASTFINPTPSFLMLSITQVFQFGNSLNVGLGISGLGKSSAPSLGAYDVDLTFDTDQLAFKGAVFGDAELGSQLDLFSFGGNLSSVELTTPGRVNLFELSLDTVEDINTLQADSFSLATLSFDVLNYGTSELTLSGNVLSDAHGNELVAFGMSVPVTTVPLPPAILMMVSGLLGLGFASKAR